MLAVLKAVGKNPSWRALFMMVVIGCRRDSRQDFSRKVGIESSEQLAFDEVKIMFLISSGVAGKKVERLGGGDEVLI